jgi:hypothetical protein
MYQLVISREIWWMNLTSVRRLYFFSEERRAADFIALKNPSASVGFEPRNLGSNDEHANL